MSFKRKKRLGFTIVELLIVIVVIAILATISVVAYTGVQTRAENTKMIQAVEGFVKITYSYQALFGTYPINTTYPCLSETTTCMKVAGSTTCYGLGNAQINTGYIAELKKVSSDLPSISTQSMTCSGNTLMGADTAASTDGKTSRFRYLLKGDVSCGSIGGTTLISRQFSGEATFCQVDLPTLT